MPRSSRRAHAIALVPPAPRDRGRFMSIAMVNETYYHGERTTRWIRRRFAPEYKITQGRNAYWWERDCEAWLDGQRQMEKGA